MKFFCLLTFFMMGCTQKYQTYNVIDKRTFDFKSDQGHNPVVPYMRKGKTDSQEFCEGQILFSKNAHAITQNSINSLVRFSCPNENYLLDAKLTEIWWTTIFYSRSCVKLESYCPKN
jgi:hypothetical protein